jgi:5'-nucleotidase/UDP-sugar diphosphatase
MCSAPGRSRAATCWRCCPSRTRCCCFPSPARNCARRWSTASTAASRNGQSGALPHASGLRIAYDPARPKGSRIVDLAVNGRALKDEAGYRLATSNYLAGGGDGYAMLKGLPVLRPAEGSPLETDVLLQAMERAGSIAPQTDGRLKALR